MPNPPSNGPKKPALKTLGLGGLGGEMSKSLKRLVRADWVGLRRAGTLPTAMWQTAKAAKRGKSSDS